MESKDLQMQFESLEKESKELFTRYLDLRKRRNELKAAADIDMGCECDDDLCMTILENQVLNSNNSHTFCHDDQDTGSAEVKCTAGQIEVVTSAAVWDSYAEITRRVLNAGQFTIMNIPAMDSWYDQTNRVQIFSRANQSKYNIRFISFDD